jgi:hypothetical protein
LKRWSAIKFGLLLSLPFLVIAFCLYQGWRETFWSSFLVNLAAGIICLAFALEIASRFAERKLETLAPKFVDLVKQLREDGLIGGKAARASVMCAVGFISEGRLRNESFRILPADQGCGVCGLPVALRDDKKSCEHCGLNRSIWGAGSHESA